jgi:hypothetical protein
MADYLVVSEDTFYTKYARKRGRGAKKHFELKEVRRSSKGKDCIFLGVHVKYKYVYVYIYMCACVFR